MTHHDTLNYTQTNTITVMSTHIISFRCINFNFLNFHCKVWSYEGSNNNSHTDHVMLQLTTSASLHTRYAGES